MDAINSAKGPEFDQHDFAAQLCQFEWWRIEPGFVKQFGGCAAVGQACQELLLWREYCHCV